MLGRNRLLLLIPAVLLVLILLGMTPFNMAQKMASGRPFTHCNQAQWKNHCLFHSSIPHNDPSIVNLNLTPLDLESMPTFDIRVLDPDSIHSSTTFNSVPLRC